MSETARRPNAASSLADPADQPWITPADGLAAVPADRLTPLALRRHFTKLPAWSPETPDESRRPYTDPASSVAAAVLVPLIMRPEGVNVLLTQRTAHLRDHAGQVAFPGGRAQPSDTSLIDTALRETEEETGLTREYVDILGSLPDYLTSSGFKVTPVIGLALPDFTLAHDPFEVADIFEVPLAFLMDPKNHRLHTATMIDGVPRRYYSMPYENRFIWGATAGMLRNLYHLLRA